MKTIVIGSAGQLGRDLVPLLHGEVVPLVRAQADLLDAETLRTYIQAARPDCVVNCAAYNLVDKAESDSDTAFAVNALGVKHLAEICRALDATLVHFSTDYVFGLDRNRRTPWNESDAPGPVSAYGLSKLTGEYWARQLCAKHFVIRTCGLYGMWGTGGKGGNFAETMLRMAAQNKPLSVVNDQRCTPSFTADVAAGAISLVSTEQYGLYHITNAGDCTWCEFAAEIFRQSSLCPHLKPITSAEFGRPAARPSYSVLAGTGCESLGLPQLRPWQEALRDYLRLRTAR